jgi:hypothetical protein
MTEQDYRSIIEHIEAATRVLLANQGQLRDGDIRLRHMLSLSASEANRRLRESSRTVLHQVSAG